MQPPSSPRGRSRISQEFGGEHKVSARVGSTGSMDRISEDYNRDVNAQATGFYGKSSELNWTRRLKREISKSSNDSDTHADLSLLSSQDYGHDSGPTPISASSYHCDDLTVFIHEQIDPFELPPRATADALFQIYLETVQSFFPILGKNIYTRQFNAFLEGPTRKKLNVNWMSILNLIFAIGAKHAHLVRAEWRGYSDDHLFYFNRARMLGSNEDAMLGHPQLQKVQITGLMAFYLMAVNQINRSAA